MKTNKVTKFGISLLSVAALGVVAPALIDTPIFGYTVVKAEEQQEPLKCAEIGRASCRERV